MMTLRNTVIPLVCCLSLQSCGPYFKQGECSNPYLATDYDTGTTELTKSDDITANFQFSAGTWPSNLEGTVDGLKIKEISKWDLSFAGEGLALDDLPLKEGESKTYRFENLPFLLKDRVLVVRDNQTQETKDVDRLVLGDGPYLGWAPSNDSVLLYSANRFNNPNRDPNVCLGWNMLQFFDGPGIQQRVVDAECSGTYRWLEGDRHLVFTHSSGYKVIANYIGKSGQIEGTLSYFTKSLSASDPYTPTTIGTTFTDPLGQVTPLGQLPYTADPSTRDAIFSPDGDEIFVPYSGKDSGLLISMSDKTTVVAERAAVGFKGDEVQRRDTSFDNRYSAVLTNETQSWSGSMSVTVLKKDKGALPGSSGCEGQANGDRFKYNLDLSLESGGSVVQAKTTMQVGFVSGYSSYD